MEVYHELTKEIGRSDCTRYYHARDRFYLNMLNYMKEEYPEVEFLLDIGHKTFEVIEEIDDINDFLNFKKEIKPDAKFVKLWDHQQFKSLKEMADYIRQYDMEKIKDYVEIHRDFDYSIACAEEWLGQYSKGE